MTHNLLRTSALVLSVIGGFAAAPVLAADAQNGAILVLHDESNSGPSTASATQVQAAASTAAASEHRQVQQAQHHQETHLIERGEFMSAPEVVYQ